MSWGWGDAAVRAFTGVEPMKVDTQSSGSHAATPLFDHPRNAAATYLGTFLLSLLQSLAFQRATGLFDDLVARPHTLAFLTSRRRAEVFDRLDERQREAVSAAATHLVQQMNLLSLSEETARSLVEIAAAPRG